MQQNEFAQLLAKYNKGQCTEAEIRMIDQWYDRLGDESALSLSEENRRALKNRLWQQIDSQTRDDSDTPPVSETNVIRWPLYRKWAAAAAVLFMIGLGTLITYRYRVSSEAGTEHPILTEAGFIDRTNTTPKPLTIKLEDGSIVHLQPQSTIRYAAESQADKREVWLKGKAFFRVQKNASRPFLVYSNSIVTRVLGTSFWVTAPNDSPTVEVAVHTGKVAVFKTARQSSAKPDEVDESSGVVLTPNQKLTIFVQETRLTRGLIDQPEPIQNTTRPEPIAFAFDNSPLPEVLKQLERRYGIEMEVGNEAVANCRFTGNITQQPLYSKLELICQAINAQYEIQGNRIVLNGSGCDH